MELMDYSPAEDFQTPKLRKVSSILSLSPSPDSGSVYEANEKPESKKAKLKRSSSESDISDRSLSPSSSDKESKKFGANLFERSPSDGQAKKKIAPVPFELSPFEGGEESMWVDDDESSVDEASSWAYVVIDKRLPKNEESMWDDDDDDSSVDEERLNEYLERLDAEDLTKKVEVKVDYSLSEVPIDAYHSLSYLQQLKWITTQFILERYCPPSRGPIPEPPPLTGTSSERWIFGSDTDSEDSGDRYESYSEDSGDRYESNFEDSGYRYESISEDSDF